MSYTRSVEGVQSKYKLEDGTVIEQANIKEERSEFADCVKDRCMAYIHSTKKCALILSNIRPGTPEE